MHSTIPYNPYSLISPSLYQQAKKRNVAIMVVGHSDHITLSFLKELSAIDAPILYTDKTYSGNTAVRDQIKPLLYRNTICHVEDCLLFIDQYPELEYLIFDMSGMLSEKVQHKKGTFYIIEDTANGLLWAQNTQLTHPLFSITHSQVKQDIENPAVAQSLFSSIICYARMRGVPICNEAILQIGFGSIGHPEKVAQHKAAPP